MNRYLYTKPSSTRVLRRGFTILELVVIITVLGIITGIVVISSVGYRNRASDSERVSDVEVITRSLERYYRTRPVSSGATYPDASTTTAAFETIVDESDATKAPGQTTNSITITNTAGNKTPTIAQYVYQPLNVDGTICTTAPCARYKLFYHLDSTDVVVTKDSLRQQ
ncbi:MAG: hypothetical protein JWO54_503 [Candidatus Saccharibacteria bacterium]|nr:hypothetical protein [Candidatus Saccharibacteria bacterium]MDB5180743.1 hypothetical protein [Candidatus Saccharibacteria bacterium]